MKNYFLKYNDFLNESLSSARKRFFETGLIAGNEFNNLSNIDFTPTKKYLEKMCAWYVEEYTKFRNRDDSNVFGMLKNTIEKNIEFFDTYNHRLPIKDINQYKTYSDFVQALSSIDTSNSKSKIKKMSKNIIKDETEVVFKNDKCIVVKPKTKEESKTWGAGTDWCISRQHDKDNAWNNYYRKQDLTFYFIINLTKITRTKYQEGVDYDSDDENPLSKIAIGVGRSGKWEEMRNFQDGWMYLEDTIQILEELEIPIELFKYDPEKPELEKMKLSEFASVSVRLYTNNNNPQYIDDWFDDYGNGPLSSESIEEYTKALRGYISENVSAPDVETVDQTELENAFLSFGGTEVFPHSIGTLLYDTIYSYLQDQSDYVVETSDVLENWSERLNDETINKIAKEGLNYTEEQIEEMDEDDLYDECIEFLEELGSWDINDNWMEGEYKQSFEDAYYEIVNSNTEYEMSNNSLTVIIDIEDNESYESEAYHFDLSVNKGKYQ